MVLAGDAAGQAFSGPGSSPMIQANPARMRLAGKLVPAGLLVMTAAIALVAGHTGRADWLEAAAFVTGAVCVWLVTRQSLWNYPFGLATTLISAFIYFRSDLTASAGLQIVFFILNLIGLFLWLYGGKGGTPLTVRRAVAADWLITAGFVGGAGVILLYVLPETGTGTRFWDIAATCLSLAAQWTQNRKILECWWLWIIVNLIYIPLLALSGLFLMALLYVIFLALAITGLVEWKRSLR